MKERNHSPLFFMTLSCVIHRAIPKSVLSKHCDLFEKKSSRRKFGYFDIKLCVTLVLDILPPSSDCLALQFIPILLRCHTSMMTFRKGESQLTHALYAALESNSYEDETSAHRSEGSSCSPGLRRRGPSRTNDRQQMACSSQELFKDVSHQALE